MDLIGTLKEDVGTDSISLISQKTGESEERAKAGVFATIPAVLAAIMKKGASGGAGFLQDLIPGQAAGQPYKMSDTDLQDGDSLMNRGKSMLENLFGPESDAVSNAVADSSGVDRHKSSGLVAMAIPVIMGAVSRLMNRNGWNFSDLLGKLFESKSAISSSLPGNLSSTLGLSVLSMPGLGRDSSTLSATRVPPSTISDSGRSHTTVVPDRTDRDTSSGMGFLKWLIPLILIALIAWWLLGRDDKDDDQVVSGTESVSPADDASGGTDASLRTGTAAGSLNAAGDWVYNLGANIQKKLPDGTEITIGENSAENKLIAFIEDDKQEVDKTTWFSLDRLYFDTGKSSLKPESKDQLENLAKIMKAYPDVKIKLGGYTDNTGDAAANKRLSSERAMSAMKELTRLGVPASRLEAEGYGSEHPVASNETEEGQAQNRRIDVRVTNK